MNLQMAFSTLESLELDIAKLYAWFAEAYRADHEAAVVFYRMHLEEKAHASLIRFEKRLAKQNPKMFRDVEVDLDSLREVTDLLGSTQRIANAPDLHDAVRVAYHIEASAAENHHRSAIAQSCQGLGHLLAGLCHGDRQHADSLRDFAARREILLEPPPLLSHGLPAEFFAGEDDHPMRAHAHGGRS
jgi:hypothetical protein